MSNKIGPPVEGGDFFGRKNELTYIMKKLVAGNHILLTAPRRVGKTSISLRVLHLLKKENWEGVYVDIEGAEDELMAIHQIIKAIKTSESLWPKVKTRVEKLLVRFNLEIDAGGFGKLQIGSKAERANNLLDELGDILLSIDSHFLIIIDELPIFLLYLQEQKDGAVRVRNFLNRLRSYRMMRHGGGGEQKILSWFFCGSVGLDHYTFANNLSSTINDLIPYQIGAFTAIEAFNFIKQQCERESLKLTAENINHLINKAGWPIPYYLRLILEEIIKEASGSPAIFEAQINRAYEKSIRTNKAALDPWIQRLKKQLSKEHFIMTQKILNEVALNPYRDFNQLRLLLMTDIGNQSDLGEALHSTLDLLISEGYLVEENKTYLFRSPFIRDWWKLRNHL